MCLGPAAAAAALWQQCKSCFPVLVAVSLLHFLNTKLLLHHSANLASTFDTTCNFPLLPYSLWFSHSWLSFCSGANGVRRGGCLETAPPYLLSSFSAGPPWNRRGSNCFFQAAQCGLASSQSEPCLHSVIDSTLAACQPIGSLAGPKPRVLTLRIHI